MKNLRLLRPSHRLIVGMSMFEMLMVVAIIGVISSMIVPNISGTLTSATREIHDRRNAQEIVGLAMSAQAADAPYLEYGDLRATVENLIEGVEAPDGPFRGCVFRLENRLSERDLVAAMKFLELTSDELLLRIPGNGYRS